MSGRLDQTRKFARGRAPIDTQARERPEPVEEEGASAQQAGCNIAISVVLWDIQSDLPLRARVRQQRPLLKRST